MPNRRLWWWRGPCPAFRTYLSFSKLSIKSRTFPNIGGNATAAGKKPDLREAMHFYHWEKDPWQKSKIFKMPVGRRNKSMKITVLNEDSFFCPSSQKILPHIPVSRSCTQLKKSEIDSKSWSNLTKGDTTINAMRVRNTSNHYNYQHVIHDSTNNTIARHSWYFFFTCGDSRKVKESFQWLVLFGGGKMFLTAP